MEKNRFCGHTYKEIGKMEQSVKYRARQIARHAEESEKAIEQRLANKVRAMKGLCLKFASASMTGYPDRLVLLPRGRVAWVELKSKGKHPTRFQELRHEELKHMGFDVYVADSSAAVDALVGMWKQNL